MINQGLFVNKINSLANKIVKLLPEEIDIPGTSWYLSGLLSGNTTSMADTYLAIPLDTLIQDENYPYPEECTTQLPVYEPSTY